MPQSTFNPNPLLHKDMLETQKQIGYILMKRAFTEKNIKRAGEIDKEISTIDDVLKTKDMRQRATF